MKAIFNAVVMTKLAKIFAFVNVNAADKIAMVQNSIMYSHG